MAVFFVEPIKAKEERSLNKDGHRKSYSNQASLSFRRGREGSDPVGDVPSPRRHLVVIGFSDQPLASAERGASATERYTFNKYGRRYPTAINTRHPLLERMMAAPNHVSRV